MGRKAHLVMIENGDMSNEEEIPHTGWSMVE